MAFPHTTFLATAVVLNCKNWFYYYSKIGVMAYRADMNDPERQRMYAAHKGNMCCLKYVTIFVIFLNMALLIALEEVSIVGKLNHLEFEVFEVIISA